MINENSIFHGFTVDEIKRMIIYEADRALLAGDIDAAIFMAHENYWDIAIGMYMFGYTGVARRILEEHDNDSITHPVAFKLLDRDMKDIIKS